MGQAQSKEQRWAGVWVRCGGGGGGGGVRLGVEAIDEPLMHQMLDDLALLVQQQLGRVVRLVLGEGVLRHLGLLAVADGVGRAQQARHLLERRLVLVLDGSHRVDGGDALALFAFGLGGAGTLVGGGEAVQRHRVLHVELADDVRLRVASDGEGEGSGRDASAG